MSTNPATAEHKKVYEELTDLLDRHTQGMTKLEILAVAANIVGKIVALQDQRSVTPAMAMEVVAKNIEAGNAHALANLMERKGTA